MYAIVTGSKMKNERLIIVTPNMIETIDEKKCQKKSVKDISKITQRISRLVEGTVSTVKLQKICL